MPQASEHLRKLFRFGPNNDGISDAEQVCRNYGCSVFEGMIEVPEHMKMTEINQPLRDAIDFLCDEWDYDWKYKINIQ